MITYLRVSESHPNKCVEGDLPGGPCYVRSHEEHGDYGEGIDNVRGIGGEQGVDGALDQWVTGEAGGIELTTILIRKCKVLINLLCAHEHAV